MSDEGFSVNDFIFDADRSNFQQLVTENSHKGPVLIHFWSRKAGPSFRLYPVLENLVQKYSGAFLLVNVDTEAQRSIANDYAITSVPTLKLMVRGKVVETLFGYQADEDLRFVLDQHVASEYDRLIQDALGLFEQGQLESAYQILGKAALDNPGYYKLPLTIATLLGNEGRIDEALNLLNALPESIRHKKPCAKLITRLEFSRLAAPIQSIDEFREFVDHNPQELPAVAMLAAWEAIHDNPAAALKRFHQVLRQDESFEQGMARRSIIRLLDQLDEDNPLVAEYRAFLRQ